MRHADHEPGTREDCAELSRARLRAGLVQGPARGAGGRRPIRGRRGARRRSARGRGRRRGVNRTSRRAGAASLVRAARLGRRLLRPTADPHDGVGLGRRSSGCRCGATSGSSTQVAAPARSPRRSGNDSPTVTSSRSTRRHRCSNARVRDSAMTGSTYLAHDLLEPIPIAPVDAILSTATFHWVPDHDRLFANLAAVLRPDGRTGRAVRWRGQSPARQRRRARATGDRSDGDEGLSDARRRRPSGCSRGVHRRRVLAARRAGRAPG